MLDACIVQTEQGIDLLLGALFHEAIRQAKVEHWLALLAAHQQFVHRRTGAAHDGVVFDGDEVIVAGRQRQHQCLIHRFDKAHIHQGGIQHFGGRFGVVQQGAKGQNGSALALSQDTSLAELQCLHL